MSQQQRVVQLSAASLALVFARDEESSRPSGGKHNATGASGQEIFADFKAQNLRSFWNKRLVKAMAEVYFQGWMENFVLIVQGNANHLEVLREAWMRRALRSPRGFVIRAVGDLSPVQMAPILQSQFIPLSEVLCSVISDMNAAQVTVNQEALISHMMKAHPGMTIPTQDILYNALGALIKERKIYHTGEGYFIVTPQTYFITNSVVKDKHWWVSENDPPSPPPITYLVSNESCMDAMAEVPPVAHCKSCSCFSPQPTPSVQDHHSVSECTGKTLRWPRDSKPSVQHQSTSTAADYQASEMSKSTTSRKDKEKDKEKAGRKFGLSLFRRNAGKKDKPKKEYATFSGQFPPAEWPVRDEDDLNNLPRDLEHAIIKRINPELTVDNLVRHTVLMKKLEERGADKSVDKGMSTEILASKQRHHPKATSKRPVSKATRSKKRAHSSREKQRGRSKTSGCPADPEADYIPSHLRHEIAVDEPDHPAYEDCSAMDAKNVYKKRIENPFQGRPGRDMVQGLSHRGQKKRDERRQGVECGERVSHRSKSWDPSRTKSSPTEAGRASAGNDRSVKGLDESGLRVDTSPDSKAAKELLGDYSSGYPDSSTLRIEDKIKHLKEGKSRGRGLKEERVKDPKHKTLQDEGVVGCASDMRHITRPPKDMDLPVHPLPPQITYHYNTTAALPSWPNSSVQHRLSPPLQALDSKGDVNQRSDHLPSPEQIGNIKTQQLCRSQRIDPSQMESDGFSDEDHVLYQKVAEDEDACSSLYLNEDSVADSSEASQTGRVHREGSFSGEGNWDSTLVEEVSAGVHQEPMIGTYQPVESRWQGPSAHHHPSHSLISQSEIIARRMFLHEDLQEPDHDARSAEALESSIFDYCQASEVDSDTETLHKSADEGDSKSTHWVCGSNADESLLKQFENLGDLSSPHTSSATQKAPEAGGTGETVENHSSTGDSGIDSPRARVSLASSSSVILEGLKRQSFLQDLEKLHVKSANMRTQQNSLLKLTPVMNV